MIKARIRWCTCRVENILTLGKLLSLWFCFLLHSIFFLISQTSYRSSEARPPPNHLGLDFHIISIYSYVVRSFLIRVRVLVICDRNSIATKREEFPARLVEVASSRLYFASRASLLQLLQQTYSALCQQPVWKSV